jgi:hypothetical protein
MVAGRSNVGAGGLAAAPQLSSRSASCVTVVGHTYNRSSVAVRHAAVVSFAGYFGQLCQAPELCWLSF